MLKLAEVDSVINVDTSLENIDISIDNISTLLQSFLFDFLFGPSKGPQDLYHLARDSSL